jgi:hypothetical protein
MRPSRRLNKRVMVIDQYARRIEETSTNSIRDLQRGLKYDGEAVHMYVLRNFLTLVKHAFDVLIINIKEISIVSARVARWYFLKTKIPIWVNFGGPWNRKGWNILWPYGTYYGRMVNFKAIR